MPSDSWSIVKDWVTSLPNNVAQELPPSTVFDPVAVTVDPPTIDLDIVPEVVISHAKPIYTDPSQLSLTELRRVIEEGELSVQDIIPAFLKRIEQFNPHLNAFVTLISNPFPSAEDGELMGIPYGVKDLFFTKGIRTTAGSRVLQDFIPSTDADVVKRLGDAGAILLGKLNTHEFAAGAWGQNPLSGPARNPWDMTRTPGGSSSGAAAAVASSMIPFALGTDTAGSVRIPAALCGIIGYKPTYGVISTTGVVPLSWSLDHVGVLCRSLQDVGKLLNVLTLHPAADYERAAAGPPLNLHGVRIGIPQQWLGMCTDGVRKSFQEAMEVFHQLGASVIDIKIPDSEEYVRVNRAVGLPESSVWHSKWLEECGEKYTDNIEIRFKAGRNFSAVDYITSQIVRSQLCREFSDLWSFVDIVATPSVPVEAPDFDACPTAPLIDLAAPFNVLGTPAISLPIAPGVAGLPVGLQLVAPPKRDIRLLRVASAFQANTNWHQQRPDIRLE